MAMRITPLAERTMWTVADIEAIPKDGNRYELLHGELLVTPMPVVGHQHISVKLLVQLERWCRAQTGWFVCAPGCIFVSETIWLEPDLCVYPIPYRSDMTWREMPRPVLVVEILSPSTTRRDRHRKRPAYLANGVKEVWLVEREMHTIERWTSASEFPDTFQGSITWTPDSALPPLVIDEMELFGSRE